MKVCSVEGCGRAVDARGLCHMHYARWRRHGTPGDAQMLRAENGIGEKVCSVEGCERARCKRDWCEMHYQRWKKQGEPGDAQRLKAENGAGNTNPQGYRRVTLSNRRSLEHRAAVEKLLGRKLHRREVVHHINGDKLDNRPENLEVMSQSEHARRHHQEEALAATGNPEARRCSYCHEWDSPENLLIKRVSRSAHHRACRAKYRRESKGS